MSEPKQPEEIGERILEMLRQNIEIYTALAIMDLPNGGGKTWNEAREIGAKVARLSLGESDNG